MSQQSDRGGFSVVEVIVAMMILSFGVLAMGASTGYVMRQVRASELRSERVAAVREASELIRGTEWAQIPAVCGSGDLVANRYTVTCEATPNGRLMQVRIRTTGPGYQDGRFIPEMAETFAINLAQPVQ